VASSRLCWETYGRRWTTLPIGEPNDVIARTRSSATSAGPVSQTINTTIGVAWYCCGIQGAGGAGRRMATSVSSGGASAMTARYMSRTAGASSAVQATGPPRISGPTSWSRYWMLVTTPKLPPPPRRAH
jgi:hypothetical protein